MPKNKSFLLILPLFLSIFLLSACEKNTTDLENNENSDSNLASVIDQTAVEDEMTEDIIEEDKDDLVVTPEVKVEKKTYESIATTIFWKDYNNDKFAYSLEYPGIASILGDDLDQHVEFIGPLEDNEWWPRISISHYDSEFYHPDAGLSVAQWATPFPEYEVGDNLLIAGQEAVHYIQKKTPQAWAADYYYFIKDGQLFLITIVHSNDRQDWPLYDKFLNSIKFQ